VGKGNAQSTTGKILFWPVKNVAVTVKLHSRLLFHCVIKKFSFIFLNPVAITKPCYACSTVCKAHLTDMKSGFQLYAATCTV
jgi:hypothetical protein